MITGVSIPGIDVPDSRGRTGLDRVGRLLPALPRTLLIWRDLARWWEQELPDGTSAVGVKLALLRRDPRFADHVREQGREVHAFTVNHPDDVRFLRELGVSAFTTDCLPEVHAALDEPLQPLAVA